MREKRKNNKQAWSAYMLRSLPILGARVQSLSTRPFFEEGRRYKRLASLFLICKCKNTGGNSASEPGVSVSMPFCARSPEGGKGPAQGPWPRWQQRGPPPVTGAGSDGTGFLTGNKSSQKQRVGATRLPAPNNQPVALSAHRCRAAPAPNRRHPLPGR